MADMALEIVEEHGSAVTLFGTDNPAEVIERAAVVATTLADLVRRQNLIVRIGQSDHVRVEGWTVLGSMLGVFPIVEWTRPVLEAEKTVGWEARVVARTRGGETVGAAESQCMRSESKWSGRDDYALRSMAQTRAVSKAMRHPLGFVMQLAGFDPTPADDMPGVIEGRAGEPQAEREHRSVGTSAPVSQAKDPASPALASEAQKKKLNVLVGTLRDKAYITTEQVYRLCGRDVGDHRDAYTSEDGELHWSPLRDALLRSEAHALIDALERIEETHTLSVELLASLPLGIREDARLRVLENREGHAGDPQAHLAWLREQVARAKEAS